MLCTPPHPADQASRIERRLGVARVALTAALTALCAVGLDSRVHWQRPGLATGPASSRAEQAQ
jgi:hypothetical protein